MGEKRQTGCMQEKFVIEMLSVIAIFFLIKPKLIIHMGDLLVVSILSALFTFQNRAINYTTFLFSHHCPQEVNVDLMCVHFSYLVLRYLMQHSINSW